MYSVKMDKCSFIMKDKGKSYSKNIIEKGICFKNIKNA